MRLLTDKISKHHSGFVMKSFVIFVSCFVLHSTSANAQDVNNAGIPIASSYNLPGGSHLDSIGSMQVTPKANPATGEMGYEVTGSYRGSEGYCFFQEELLQNFSLKDSEGIAVTAFTGNGFPKPLLIANTENHRIYISSQDDVIFHMIFYVNKNGKVVQIMKGCDPAGDNIFSIHFFPGE